MPKIEFPIEKGGSNRCKMQWSFPSLHFIRNLIKFKLSFLNWKSPYIIFIDNKEVLRFSNWWDLKTMKRVKLESGQILEVIHDTEFSFYLDGIRLPAQYAFMNLQAQLTLRMLCFYFFFHLAFPLIMPLNFHNFLK